MPTHLSSEKENQIYFFNIDYKWKWCVGGGEKLHFATYLCLQMKINPCTILFTCLVCVQPTTWTQRKWPWRRWNQAPWRWKPSWKRPTWWRRCSTISWCDSMQWSPRRSPSTSSLSTCQMVSELYFAHLCMNSSCSLFGTVLCKPCRWLWGSETPCRLAGCGIVRPACLVAVHSNHTSAELSGFVTACHVHKIKRCFVPIRKLPGSKPWKPTSPISQNRKCQVQQS